MCIRYSCTGCHNLTVHHCESADLNQVNPNCYLPTIDPEPPTIAKRCFTCKTIQGATVKLEHLAFEQPWLLTEGLSGSDNLEQWEREHDTNMSEVKLKSINWSDVGDEEILGRLKSMGLYGLEGKEELNDGHGITRGQESEKTSWTKKTELDSGGQMQRSFWGSEGETLAADEKEEKEKNLKSVDDYVHAEQDKEQDEFVGIGGLFE